MRNKLFHLQQFPLPLFPTKEPPMRKTAVCLMVVSLIALFPVMNAAAGPALDRIMAKGQLIVGTSGEQPPMTVTTKNGDLIGLDIDIARAMAQGLGVDIQFAKMPFAELLPALEAGKVDMVISGMTITPARNRKVAFVGPYYVSGKGILALEKRYAELQDANGLNAPEVTVATLENSTSATFAETLMPKAKLTTTASYDEAIRSPLERQSGCHGGRPAVLRLCRLPQPGQGLVRRGIAPDVRTAGHRHGGRCLADQLGPEFHEYPQGNRSIVQTAGKMAERRELDRAVAIAAIRFECRTA
jgi:polar amino acid transport system substrate-binding protein